MKRNLVFIAILSFAGGCKKKSEDGGGGGGGGTGTGTGTGTAATIDAAGTGSGSGTGSAPSGPISVTGFSTPESVIHDADADVYLVSNINGGAVDADDNGFISKVSPEETKITELKWIDGAAADVKLDAPKGLAISAGILWVADINVVRRFDVKTGKSAGDVKIPGASFLNDVVSDGADGVYVSDTGVDAKFQATGSDAIYHVGKDGRIKPLIKNKDLGGPNGLYLAANKSVWAATFGTGELYEVTARGQKQAPTKPGKGQLDGIAGLADDDLFVSSWEGQVIYRGNPTKGWTELLPGTKAPADIGLDAKRKRLLVPKFQDNEVLIQPL